MIALLLLAAATPSLTLTNLKGPIARASGKAPARSTAELWAQINELPPALPVPTPTIAGQVPAVASNLDVQSLLRLKGIPRSMAPDVVGAFRFVCSAGQTLPDDPLVYPGQPGKAHLHTFFGNLGANANSTYVTLRSSGDSTCTDELNRSAYWIPAMLDGRGNVVRPDDLNLYYKGRPKSDPVCTTAAKACVDVPRGFNLIFGWDQFRPTEDQPENAARFNFECVANGHPVSGVFPNLVEVAKVCKPGQQIHAGIQTPLCWNGTDLDSPDHRSHMADMRRDASTGYVPKCPVTHPYILPQLTLGITWTVGEGDDATKWTFSSDHMKPGGLPGETFHADYREAWEDRIRERWHAGCINLMLDCSDGDLGDGQIMARGRYYPSKPADPRLVPVPQ